MNFFIDYPAINIQFQINFFPNYCFTTRYDDMENLVELNDLVQSKSEDFADLLLYVA